MRTLKCLIWVALLTASFTLISGCKKPEVQVYNVPKEQNVPTSNLLPPASQADAGAQPTWTPAPQWQTLPSNQIRKGNYVYSDDAGSAEITVTSFPGNTGGLLLNVNRWLGQAGLPPVEASELESLAQTQELSAGIEATIVDLKDDSETPDSTRIVAAIVPFAGQSWFFKMSGPYATVDSQLDAFDEMVSNLSFGMAASPSPETATPKNESEDIAFRAPDGWTPAEGNALRLASFTIEKQGSPPADFSIIAFPGDTGGVVANVNRWRRQIGLEEWTEEEVNNASQSLNSDYGHEFLLFDLKPSAAANADTPKERILAAILEHNGKSWFFKLRGEPFLLDTQMTKFRSLLLSVHFDHEGHSH